MKFKDLYTGNILDAQDEFVISEYEKFPHRYSKIEATFSKDIKSVQHADEMKIEMRRGRPRNDAQNE